MTRWVTLSPTFDLGRQTRVRSLVVGLGYVGLQLAAAMGPAVAHPDTASYFNLHFFAGEQRTWTVPLLYALLPGSDEVLVAAQVLIASLCWLALAGAVLRSVTSRWLGYVATAVVLALGLTGPIARWNAATLSESLSVSLLVLLLSASIRLTQRRTMLVAAWWSFALVLWLFVRPAHLFLVFPLALGMTIWWLWSRQQAVALMAGVTIVASLWALPFLADKDNNTAVLNRLAIISQRVMAEPEMRSFFEESGMPVTPGLVAEARDGFSWGSSPLLDDAVGRWAEDQYNWTYLRFAVRHPVWSVRAPARQAPVFLTTDVAPNGRYRSAVLPPAAGRVLMRSRWSLLAGFVAATAVSIAVVARRAITPRLIIPAALLVAAGAQLLLVWHLAPDAYARLLLVTSVLTRLGLLLLIIWGLDELLTPRRRRVMS